MKNNAKSMIKTYIICFTIVISCLAKLIYDYLNDGNDISLKIFFVVGCLIIVYGIACITIVNHLNRNSAYKDAINIIREYNQNDKPKDRNVSRDILELMIINLEEIRNYYKMSKIMAGASFILSLLMCVSGFGLIALPIISYYFLETKSIQPAISIIGGTVVEVVAGTSLIVFKKSLEQLNQYYESLHNNERFLSLIKLVDQLSNNKKDEAYINIINSQLELLKKSL